MTFEEFVERVEVMRIAQKTYFRDRTNLDHCKRLESFVDMAIQELKRPPDLFDKLENGE